MPSQIPSVHGSKMPEAKPSPPTMEGEELKTAKPQQISPRSESSDPLDRINDLTAERDCLKRRNEELERRIAEANARLRTEKTLLKDEEAKLVVLSQERAGIAEAVKVAHKEVLMIEENDSYIEQLAELIVELTGRRNRALDEISRLENSGGNGPGTLNQKDLSYVRLLLSEAQTTNAAELKALTDQCAEIESDITATNAKIREVESEMKQVGAGFEQKKAHLEKAGREKSARKDELEDQLEDSKNNLKFEVSVGSGTAFFEGEVNGL